MRLQPYTPEQTDQLLADIKFIATHAVIVNVEAVEILEKKYAEYLEHFRWTLFKWKPLDKKGFVESLYIYKSYIIENKPSDGYSRSTFQEHFLNEPSKFYRGETFHFRLYQHQLEKYGVPLITDDENKIIKIASELTDFMFDYDFHKKYSVLVNYAHRPFEFDEVDIGWIERVKRYKKLVEYNL
ncbi:hypothetical protein FDH34_gp100 [Serratia phage BF]|uniref:Uncharacterized protein n=1 Tax=Serratia phage BF TaxID=1962671 RepID=A0A1S6UA63_9CAUD|nr:hypothetical protein FDH34_gp100 [Serratia phage BF]AQW88625.1 hypothetical protein BF_0100 [Serratia phage BF]